MATSLIWKDDKIAISKLSLDLKNPRIPEFARKNEPSVIEYLLEFEDVMDIAENISLNGYHRSATSIATRESGKLVVLDGNRRLAACKLLLNPNLTSKENFRKKLKKLALSSNVKELKKVKVSLAPNREAAEKEIWDIHMNVLHKPWQVIQKNRKYKSLIQQTGNTIESISKRFGVGKSVMYKDITKLTFYERILGILKKDKDKSDLLKSGLNKIEKIIYPQHGKDFLGYNLDDQKANLEIKDLAKFDRNLKAITPYILSSDEINGMSLGPQCKATEVQAVFARLDPTYINPTGKAPRAAKAKPPASATPSASVVHITPKLIRRRSSVKYSPADASNIIDHLLIHFDAVANQLQLRRLGRKKFLIRDEYDVQDLLHALLALFFDDVVNEAWNPSYGFSPSRGDFLLFHNGTIIEVKATHTMSGNVRKKLEKDLSDDLIKYSANPACKKIYFFVYDPQRKITKPRQFEQGIERVKMAGIEIRAIITP